MRDTPTAPPKVEEAAPVEFELDACFGDPLTDNEFQSTKQPTARTMKRAARERLKFRLKKETLQDLLPAKVKPRSVANGSRHGRTTPR